MSLNASALAAKRRLEPLERGQQPVRRLVERGEVDRGREDVVGRLPHVHVVVRVRARRASRAPRWRSCSTTCPSRSGRRRRGTARRASPAAISSAAAAILLGELGVEQPELGVGARGGALDAAEPAHDRQRHALAGDGEVRDGLGGLAAPQLLLGALHAHPPVAGIGANASGGASAGSGVTSCGSSSARQCEQTSTGSATPPQVWRSTTGASLLAEVLVAPAHDRHDRGIERRGPSASACTRSAPAPPGSGASRGCPVRTSSCSRAERMLRAIPRLRCITENRLHPVEALAGGSAGSSARRGCPSRGRWSSVGSRIESSMDEDPSDRV